MSQAFQTFIAIGQLIAAFTLIGVTWVYVRHTKRLVEIAAGERKADREDRIRLAYHSIKFELIEMNRVCEVTGGPAKIVTQAWDTMKGDLPQLLGNGFMNDVCCVYVLARQCNMICDIHAANADTNGTATPGVWRKNSADIRDQLASAIQRLGEIKIDEAVKGINGSSDLNIR